MSKSIKVGSRGSRLALIQAESVVAAIKKLNPYIEVSIERITTKGDRDPHARLENMGIIGVFVKELEEALLDKWIDLAVHSLKDMPTQIPRGLCLAAATERLDSRDILASKGEGLDELAPGSRIGTGSFRRVVQLTTYRPDLEACSIRGNVDTRLRKVSDGEVDGMILAAAAMERLGLKEKITQYLPLEHFLPAVGQGALGIEARIDDDEIADFVSNLNHQPTWRSVTAERAFLSTLGGGCRAPIAALGTVEGSIMKLEGMVANTSGENILHASEEGDALSPEEVGVKLANKMLAMGASEFIAEEKAG